ncbi:MAG TPA: hypothetical protein VLM16_05825 [Ginsengibacter sp.]|nr:hypothetical protein [Ginsengibacter sp.]
MNKEIESNKYKKEQLKRGGKPNLSIIESSGIYQGKPFTAWPGNITANAGKNFANDLIEGRTKSGGYVVYPIKRNG